MNIKKLQFVITFIVFIASTTLIGQTINVAESLVNKDYTSIKSQLANELDVCIMDDTQINNKEETMSRISGFFSDKVISKYEVLHKGANNGSGSKYDVYKLILPNRNIRAFVYFENEGDKMLIHEIRFDKF